MKINLEGKTALVCGASEGIGAASAHELALLGANVILLARSKDKLDAVLSSLPGPGKHSVMLVDLSDRNLLKETVDKYLKEKGPINILVNNTGGPKSGPLSEASEEDFLNAFKNHVLVSNLLAELLVFGMKQSGYGRIINIVSISVKMPIHNLGVSNTIRGAMASWSKTLSYELGEHGITVNNVLPGYTKTSRLTSLMLKSAEDSGKNIEDVENNLKTTIPMNRFGTAAEVANAVAFLASPAASYISGVNLPVDGAWTKAL